MLEQRHPVTSSRIISHRVLKLRMSPLTPPSSCSAVANLWAFLGEELSSRRRQQYEPPQGMREGDSGKDVYFNWGDGGMCPPQLGRGCRGSVPFPQKNVENYALKLTIVRDFCEHKFPMRLSSYLLCP